MATSHEFLATDEDFLKIVDWLLKRGAVRVGRNPRDSATLFHFPEFGRLFWWGEQPSVSYPVNSVEWRESIIIELHEEDPDVPNADHLRSPIMGAYAPVQDPEGCWSSAIIWFPTPSLGKKFPGLARINNQFQRWLRKNPLVFDNIRYPVFNPYPNQLIQFEWIVRRVYALPAAFAFLNRGGHFTDYARHLFSASRQESCRCNFYKRDRTGGCE